jgi:hypothetical protein
MYHDQFFSSSSDDCIMISDTDYQLDELEANIPALDQH